MRGKLTLISLIVGFVLHLADVGLDIYVATQYFIRGERWWAVLTLVFILLPVIIVTLINNILNVDGSRSPLYERILRPLFIVTINFVHAMRDWKRENRDSTPCGSDYWRCSCQSCELFRERTKKCAYSTRELAFTRLLETLTESAPQWCLQNYVMLRQWYFPWYTILSTIFSFLSLAWCITKFEKASKLYAWYANAELIRADYPRAFASYVTFFAWQLCILLSRLPALVIFAYVFGYYIFVALGIHVAVFLVVSYTLSKDSVNGWCDRIKLCAKLSVVSLSIMFHISGTVIAFVIGKDSDYRKVIIILYHVALTVENMVLVSLAVWAAPARTTHLEDLTMFVLLFVFLGVVGATFFMTMYYCCCHPSEFTESPQREEVDDENYGEQLLKSEAENDDEELLDVETDNDDKQLLNLGNENLGATVT